MSGEAIVSDAPAPTTRDIVETAVETAETAATEPAPVEASGPETPAAVDPPKALSLEEQLLHEFGFKDLRRPDGREHYIPRSKVLNMISSGLKRGQARWDGERDVISKDAADLKAFRDELIADVRGEDTKKFLERISEYNPAFRSYLQPAAPAHVETPQEARPEPDIDLGDGRRTYSVEQNEKLVEWKAQQLLDARLKPFEEREKAQAERAQLHEAQQAVQSRVSQQIESAKAWPNWAQYEGDVLTLLQADSAQAQAAGTRPTLTLREAYLQAQVQYLSTDDTAKRARWIEEANKAATSTAVPRHGVEPTRAPGARDTKDVVREAIRRLEKSS